MCKEMVFDELSVNDTKSNNKSNRRKIQNDESKMTNKDTLMLSKLAINSKSPRLSAELKSFRSSQGKQAEESIPDKSSSDKKSTKEISNSRNSSVKRKLSDGLSSNLHEPTPVIESTVLNPMYCSEVYKEKPLSEVYGNFQFNYVILIIKLTVLKIFSLFSYLNYKKIRNE